MALLSSFLEIIPFCKVLSITIALPLNAAVLEKKIEKKVAKKVRVRIQAVQQQITRLEMALLNSFLEIIPFCKVLSITNLLAINAAVLEKKVQKKRSKKVRV